MLSLLLHDKLLAYRIGLLTLLGFTTLKRLTCQRPGVTTSGWTLAMTSTWSQATSVASTTWNFVTGRSGTRHSSEGTAVASGRRSPNRLEGTSG